MEMNNDIEAQLRQLSGIAGKLRAERDEARREVCYLVAELDMLNHISTTAESVALEYEWDCFENM